MQQLDIPIITKTYELYRALHDLQKGIPKMERYSLWSRVEATALQMLEGFVHAGYLPCEQRAQKLTRLAAEVDMLRMFIRLAVDIKVLPLKKAVPLQERLDEIGRMLGGWIKELPYVWESRFQHQYGCLRDEVTKTLTEYLNCGILAHGAARVYCDRCKHSLLVAFSCKRRGVCPSCGAKRAVKFAEHIYNEVIEDVPHRHTVFTIPKRLRVFFKYDRKLNTIFFKAAWGALSEVLGIDERADGW